MRYNYFSIFDSDLLHVQAESPIQQRNRPRNTSISQKTLKNKNWLSWIGCQGFVQRQKRIQQFCRSTPAQHRRHARPIA